MRKVKTKKTMPMKGLSAARAMVIKIGMARRTPGKKVKLLIFMTWS